LFIWSGFIGWVKEHKTELIIAGATVAGVVLVTRNWDSIKRIITIERITVPAIQNNEKAATQVVTSVISNDILDNLTGNKMIARELGNKTLCSAQVINNRIVDAGLATKLPCGEYSLTDAGKKVGESTLKTTWAGHTFSNIEWDEKIIDLLFSPEELHQINKHKQIAQEILKKDVA